MGMRPFARFGHENLVFFFQMVKSFNWKGIPLQFRVMGDLLTGGDLYANVIENSLVQHHVTLPPDAMDNTL
nr:V-type proton ATPase catalytic subunit A [Ipomoea batatas]